MANLIICSGKYCLLIIFLGSAAAIGLNNYNCTRRGPLVFYAAENRALNGFMYAKKTVRSAVLCGRECSMDGRCKSLNYYKNDNSCQMNNNTRHGHDDGFFVEDKGSVYFDGDEDTPLLSLPDSVPMGRYESCQKLYEAGYIRSGAFTIYPAGFIDTGLQVYCDQETEDGVGWLVFQRRQDGSEDFYRNWIEYRAGFGDLSGEFWLGNDNLLELTSQGTWELRIDLGDWEGDTAWAKYSAFSITGQNYNLQFGSYDTSSTAGDSLAIQRGRDFSTKDNDNDMAINNRECALKHHGAWWFKACAYSHLNGLYYTSSDCGFDQGIEWHHWHNAYSMKSCSMKIRQTKI